MMACAGSLAGLHSVVAAATTTSSVQPVTGAGATLATSLYRVWGAEFEKQTGTRVDYFPTGSGLGWQMLTDGRVDFSATEIPSAQARLNEHQYIEFKISAASIVVAANFPGMPPSAQLNMTPDILARIYTSSIRWWCDPAIREINPGITLPDLTITPVSRDGSSGTTFALSRYLSQSVPAWKSTIGVTSRPDWDYGLLTRSTSAMALTVARIPGAIGYLVNNSVQAQNLSRFRLGESTQGYMPPPGYLDVSPGWPLSADTYALVSVAASRIAASRKVIEFFNRGITQWQSITQSQGFETLGLQERNVVLSLWRDSGLIN